MHRFFWGSVYLTECLWSNSLRFDSIEFAELQFVDIEILVNFPHPFGFNMRLLYVGSMLFSTIIGKHGYPI